MFCSKCGKEISNESEFCSYCGNKTNNNISAESIVNDKLRQKGDIITLLKAANDYISTFWPYYSQIAEYKEKQRNIQKDIDRGIFSYVTTGIIALLIGFCLLVCSIPNLASANNNFFSGFAIFIGIIFLIPAIISIIVGIVSFALIPKRKNNIENNKSEIIMIDQKLQQLDYKIRELHEDKEIIQKQTSYHLFFPNIDAGPNDISYIINLLTTGRADSFKEALNLYDEHLHRNNLERMASQQLNYARKAAAAASVAAASASEAAAAAKRTADETSYIAHQK